MPIALRLSAAGLLLLAGGTLLAVAVLGARSRLRRNRWLGIRTPATLRSEPAWVRAHRVGAAPAGAAGAIALLGGAVLVAGSESAALDWVLLVVAALGGFGLAAVAGWFGDRAASRVRPQPQPGCAGSCAGCERVAGCQTQPASASPAGEPGDAQ